jgi:hypothetical protein
MNTHSHAQDGPQPKPAIHLNDGRPSYSSTNPEVGSGSAGPAVRRLAEPPNPRRGQVPSSPAPRSPGSSRRWACACRRRRP